MQTYPLDAREKKNWLRLIRTPKIGPVTFHQLIHRFGSAEEALRQVPSYAKASSRGPGFQLAPVEVIEQEIQRGDAFGASLICACEPPYPAALRHIADAPPILWTKGGLDLMQKPGVAIVGARNASMVGRTMAQKLANDLGQAGYAIISGLARGIDGAAHQAALATGTIAVVAGGIDVVYPPEHGDLTEAISTQGLLVSESPIGYRPVGRDFPKRNRIISGLSHGVIVVEAATRSGSLITARLAGEQGRELFAVPGSPLDPRCQGTNQLLRDGAILIEQADDVISNLQNMTHRLLETEDVGLFETPHQPPEKQERQHIEAKLLEALSFTPTHRDLLLREIGAPPAWVNDGLLELVLSGKIEEQSGGYFCLRPQC